MADACPAFPVVFFGPALAVSKRGRGNRPACRRTFAPGGESGDLRTNISAPTKSSSDDLPVTEFPCLTHRGTFSILAALHVLDRMCIRALHRILLEACD